MYQVTLISKDFRFFRNHQGCQYIFTIYTSLIFGELSRDGAQTKQMRSRTSD